MSEEDAESIPAAPQDREHQPQINKISYDELSGGTSSVQIAFGDAIYTLRRTRGGRLVLNK